MKIEVEGIEELYEKIRSIKGKLAAFGAGSVGPSGEYAYQLGMIAEDARMRISIIVSKGYFLYAHFTLISKKYKIYTAVSVPSHNKCWSILAQNYFFT